MEHGTSMEPELQIQMNWAFAVLRVRQVTITVTNLLKQQVER